MEAFTVMVILGKLVQVPRLLCECIAPEASTLGIPQVSSYGSYTCDVGPSILTM